MSFDHPKLEMFILVCKISCIFAKFVSLFSCFDLLVVWGDILLEHELFSLSNFPHVPTDARDHPKWKLFHKSTTGLLDVDGQPLMTFFLWLHLYICVVLGTCSLIWRKYIQNCISISETMRMKLVPNLVWRGALCFRILVYDRPRGDEVWSSRLFVTLWWFLIRHFVYFETAGQQ